MLYVRVQVVRERKKVKSLDVTVFHDSEKLFGTIYGGENEKRFLKEFVRVVIELKKHDRLKIIVWKKEDHKFLVKRLKRLGLELVCDEVLIKPIVF